MTVRGLAENIASNLGRPHDKIFITRMEANILDIRARLIHQYGVQRNVIYPITLQDLDNLELEEAEDLLCETDVDIKVMRTVERLPNPIRVKAKGSSFVYVGANDRSSSFTYAKPQDVPELVKNRFTATLPYYTYLNKHIYVFNSKANSINVRAAFADPTELRRLKDCSGNYCFTGDFELEQDMSDVIERMIYEKIKTPVEPSREEITIDDNDKANT